MFYDLQRRQTRKEGVEPSPFMEAENILPAASG